MKVPENSEKVFSGLFYEIYHWKQVEKNGFERTIEHLKRNPSVQVVPVVEGKIALGRETDLGDVFYTLFAGSVDGGNPLVAAKRELLEESGLTSDDWEVLYEETHPYFKLEWDVHCFIARNCKKGEQKLDEAEDIRVEYVTFDEFIDIVVREDFRNHDFALHVLRMARLGELDAFRRKLGL